MTPPKTVFTDDDVKRFKQWIEDCYEFDKFYCRTYEIEALLARLEAAEDCKKSLLDVLNHGLQYENGEVHEANIELAKERIEAYRRSCGR